MLAGVQAPSSGWGVTANRWTPRGESRDFPFLFARVEFLMLLRKFG